MQLSNERFFVVLRYQGDNHGGFSQNLFIVLEPESEKYIVSYLCRVGNEQDLQAGVAQVQQGPLGAWDGRMAYMESAAQVNKDTLEACLVWYVAVTHQSQGPRTGTPWKEVSRVEKKYTLRTQYGVLYR